MPFLKILSPTELLAIKGDNNINCAPVTQVVSNNANDTNGKTEVIPTNITFNVLFLIEPTNIEHDKAFEEEAVHIEKQNTELANLNNANNKAMGTIRTTPSHTHLLLTLE